MQDRFTYSTQQRNALVIYADKGFDPPDAITATHDGRPVEFIRLSDMSLVCERADSRVNARGETVAVTGECGSFDCHRRQLGDCQCGRHVSPVRFVRAEARKEVE